MLFSNLDVVVILHVCQLALRLFHPHQSLAIAVALPKDFITRLRVSVHLHVTDKLGAAAGMITVRVRGGGVQPARFPIGTTGKQLLDVLRGLPDFGDGTCDDIEGFAVPPSNEQLAPGNYFFLPGECCNNSADAEMVLVLPATLGNRRACRSRLCLIAPLSPCETAAAMCGPLQHMHDSTCIVRMTVVVLRMV